MPVRIDVQYTVPDTRADVKKRYFEGLGFKGKIQEVGLVDSYVLDTHLTAAERKAAAELFVNPLVERATFHPVRSRAPQGGRSRAFGRAASNGIKFDWAIEIGYLPGVTDNVGATAREAIEDRLRIKFNGQGVFTSQVFFVRGKLSHADAKRMADSLHNPLIQRATVKSFREFQRDGGMGKEIPRVKLRAKPRVDKVNLEVSDEELARIGKEGVADRDGTRRGPLALDLASMKTIRDYFRSKKRKPTDVELESLAQTWSEHCKHTIFADPIDDVARGLYRTYIKDATNTIRKRKGKKDFCVSVFTDNSGAIAFDDKYLVTHKVETHNSPSALDPFGGSITGIVGVNRDTLGFGLGAKPVANYYGFCLADPRDTSELYKAPKRKQKMLSAARIMSGVISGINVGGNCSGIPTPQGFILFDPRYRGKPLVFAGTVGLIPRTSPAGSRGELRKLYEKAAQAGDYVVVIGGRVGQDGIHGATFSSEAMDTGSPATAVQIGDPITQKKLSDALVKEARDRDLYHSITDNGAGGISCSVPEMAKECGGAVVSLEKVPLKYPGLEPWKIWISESQERMTLAVPPAKWKEFKKLMESRGVEATVIGRFTKSPRCVVKCNGATVMDMDMGFLHNGLPKRQLITSAPNIRHSPKLPLPRWERRGEGEAAILAMLARPNIASFAFISEQYDHEVQAGSILKPLQGRGRVNGDASAFRPVLTSERAVILSSGITPSYSELDPYRMAAAAIDTAVRTAVAAGADPDYLALLDNFCWCSSNEPERLWQLKRAVQACYDTAVAYGTPFISGKDSMFNDFKGYDENGKPLKISIPPTLLISSIGVVPDAAKTVSLDLKRAGDLVYVLGDTYNEMGGSEYVRMIDETSPPSHGKGEREGVRFAWGGVVPKVHAAKNLRLYRAFYSAVQDGLVASAVSVGRGGLAVALARTSMGGMLGMNVSLKKLSLRGAERRGNLSDAVALFSESQGRIVVSVAPEHKRKFEKAMRGTSFANIGTVTTGKTVFIEGKKVHAKLSHQEMLRAYRSTFKNY